MIRNKRQVFQLEKKGREMDEVVGKGLQDGENWDVGDVKT